MKKFILTLSITILITGCSLVSDVKNSFSPQEETKVVNQNQIIDPSGYDLIGNLYYKDDKNVYYSTSYSKGCESKSGNCRKVENADPKSFTSLSHNYGKDNNSIFFCHSTHCYTVTENSLSFDFIAGNYSKNKNHVFFCNDDCNILENVDPNSFKYLDEFYTKDKNYVFHNKNIIEDANPESFIKINKRYSKDKNHVFINNKILVDADPNSFQVLRDNLSKDENSLYIGEQIIDGIDAISFEFIDKTLISKDKNSLYISDHWNTIISQLEGSDPETFTIIADTFKKGGEASPIIKSNNLVFWGKDEIKDADTESFTFLNGLYAVDKNYIYPFGEEKIKLSDEVDGSSLEIIGQKYYIEGYFKDKNHVYFLEDWKNFKLNLINNADPGSFEELTRTIGKDKNSLYFKNYLVDSIENQELYKDDKYWRVDISDVIDKESIEKINNIYWKDKNYVYGDTLGMHFEIEDGISTEIYAIDDNYATDGNTIYSVRYGHMEMAPCTIEADVASFKSLGQGYAKDKNNIYSKCEIVEADFDTFEVLKHPYSYAKDKNSLYFGFSSLNIEGIDINSIVFLSDLSFKDKNNTYTREVGRNFYGNFVIFNENIENIENIEPTQVNFLKLVDGDSIEHLSSSVYKDKNHVYDNGIIIDQADTNSFKHLGGFYFIDKNGIYIGGRMLSNFDIATTEHIGDSYLIDKDKVYYDKNLIEEADIESFEYLDYSYAKDKNNAYSSGKIIENVSPENFSADYYEFLRIANIN